MHYLTYVVGAEPDKTLERWEGITWDWYAIGGRWGHLRRRARRRLPPPYNIVLKHGTWISTDDVGEDLMAEILRVLDPSERITVIDLHN